MKVRVALLRELGAPELARWAEILAAAPALGSPYFTPEFVACAAEVRDGVEVGVLEDSSGIMGFFPFERDAQDVAHPVGQAFSDFQGLVTAEAAEWDPRSLLRGCRLSAWRFDHLLVTQRPTLPFHWTTAPSPYVDLSNGFEGWRAERKRAGSKELDKLAYEARKTERRLGPVRFQLHAADDAAFEALLRWKGAQLRASGLANRLSTPWVVRLLERVRATQGTAFSGVLSTLHVGDALAAVHLGMRTPTVFHYWLPAYDPALASFSPGQLCFVEIAKAAAALGAQRVDLGKGDEPYKQRLMSGALHVAEGAVHVHAPVGAMWRARHRLVSFAKRSPLRDALKAPRRWMDRMLAAREGA